MDRHPDLDPLVRGMDPRIRIRSKFHGFETLVQHPRLIEILM
jgi:hypothetical protein